MKYGRLLVLNVCSKMVGNQYKKIAECVCECGTMKSVNYYDLTNGKILSCGCLRLQRIMERNANPKRKTCEYEFFDDCAVGIIRSPKTHFGKRFEIDKEDYDKIKKYWWRLNSSGYVVTTIVSKEVSLHRLLLEFPDEKVDHVDRNKLNNKKANLRIISDRFSAINKNPTKSNTSGVIGVNFTDGGWVARISSDLGKRLFLGKYREKQEAVLARLVAEKEFYGEYSPQKHLFDEYGVQ